MQFLLAAGADKDVATEDRATPVPFVAGNGQFEVVRLLLEAGRGTQDACFLHNWLKASETARLEELRFCSQQLAT